MTEEIIFTNLDLLQVIAIVSAMFGAALSTFKGHSNTNEPYNKKMLLSSLIISIMGSLTLINFKMIPEQFNEIGLVGTVIVYLLLGFGADQGLSKLDKARSEKASPGPSGDWGTQNTLNSINARIERLENEIIQSEEELKKYKEMEFPDPKWKTLFTGLIQREIRKTKNELDEIKERKARLISAGWLPA